MPLHLVYQGQTSIPVEVEGLTPSLLREQTLDEIERFEIFHGNEKLPLAELFSVSGSAADQRIEFEGNLAGVHWIGAHQSSGHIHVAGDAGRHVGSEMSAGEIHVHGNASDWVGGEMHGGLIHVHGSAGNLIGSAYRGSPRGMTGGTILIHGAVGNEVGHTMRRGLLAVGGCGDFVGLNMIAGTIFVFGECGMRPGAGMRRGTIGLFGAAPTRLLPTFRSGSRDNPLIVQLLFRQLRKLGYPIDEQLMHSQFRMFHGDMVATGRGELLLRDPAA